MLYDRVRLLQQERQMISTTTAWGTLRFAALQSDYGSGSSNGTRSCAALIR